MTRKSVAMVTTFGPTRCGIGRFADSLSTSLHHWGTEVDVVRVLQSGDTPSRHPRVVMEFDPASSISLARATTFLNRYDIVIVQHEFGIFGPSEGVAAADLVEWVSVPVMVVLHTVPLRPGVSQHAIINRLARAASALVVPSHSARVELEDLYSIPSDAVAVIPHGSAWAAAETTPRRRSRLLTWGLLGPGKGVERALEAVSRLHDLDGLSYRVVGQTHPNVVRQQGFRYRDSLERLVGRLGLEDVVHMDEGYKSDEDLYRLVMSADVIVIPYDNSEQISSGVLTEAVSAGKPVVATAFPHAHELLGSGAGIVVGHDDSNEMAAAIRRLLTDDVAYHRAVTRARSLGRQLSWNEVARRYRESFDRLGSSIAVG